jgi:hypothetical protein
MIQKLLYQIQRCLGVGRVLLKFENIEKLLGKQKDIISLQYLTPYMNKPTTLPATAWGARASLLHHVVNELILGNYSNIIEFGSGLSTLIFARFISYNGLKCKVFSVESDHEWAARVEETIVDEGLGDIVSVVHAPLVKSPYSFKEHEMWYDCSALENIIPEKAGIVLVDGPPEIHPYSRYGAVPFLRNRMSKDSIVFLDDSNRQKETEIAEEWKKRWGELLVAYETYSVISYKLTYDSTPIWVHAE